jgi:DNA-binding MarR family transcriptional regulator
LYKYEQKASPALGQPAISQLDRCGPRLPGDGTDLARELQPLDIKPPHLDILVNLFRTPGISQQDLADKLLVGRSNLSMLLAADGKARTADPPQRPSDRRVLRLELTPKAPI